MSEGGLAIKSTLGRTHEYLVHRLRVVRRGHGACFLQMRTQVPEMANTNAREVDDEDRARHSTVDVHPRT